MSPSNIERVIDDVDDVRNDLRAEFEKRISRKMRMMKISAERHILNDPHNRGRLLTALSYDREIDEELLSFSVGVDMGLVEYAAIVEFGSGQRSNVAYDKGNQIPSSWAERPGAAVPLGYPYEAPDIQYNEKNPTDTRGYETFYGFVKHIEEWMREKPVMPETGNYFASAALIARAIVRKGNFAHPYLRPAWFTNELHVRKAARNALRNATR